MSLQQSSSGFRKKAKVKLSKIFGGKNKQGANVGDEGSDPPTSSQHSEPTITVGGELGGDVGVGIGADDPRRDDSLSVSRPAAEIGHDQGEDDEASGGEANQEYLDPHPHSRAEIRSGQERRDIDEKRAGQVDLPPLPESDIGEGTIAPPIPRGSGSESA